MADNDNCMMRIAITPEEIRPDEATWITTLLESGWDMVHMRHPQASLRDIRDIIVALPQRLHKRIRLHGYFELINEFNLGGLHLNRRCPQPPANYTGPYSRSCHSIEEVTASADCDYVTLSPIFDSVSKPGYGARFSQTELLSIDKISSPLVIALGGVTPERVAALEQYNFSGYAVLGAINQFM